MNLKDLAAFVRSLHQNPLGALFFLAIVCVLCLAFSPNGLHRIEVLLGAGNGAATVAVETGSTQQGGPPKAPERPQGSQ